MLQNLDNKEIIDDYDPNIIAVDDIDEYNRSQSRKIDDSDKPPKIVYTLEDGRFLHCEYDPANQLCNLFGIYTQDSIDNEIQKYKQKFEFVRGTNFHKMAAVFYEYSHYGRDEYFTQDAYNKILSIAKEILAEEE